MIKDIEITEQIAIFFSGIWSLKVVRVTVIEMIKVNSTGYFESAARASDLNLNSKKNELNMQSRGLESSAELCDKTKRHMQF